MPVIRRHFRHVEEASGTGSLHNSEHLLATVTYSLRVLQEIIGTRHRLGLSAVKGMIKVSGNLTVDNGSRLIDGDQLTLRLADGRSLPFRVMGTGPDYTVEPTALHA